MGTTTYHCDKLCGNVCCMPLRHALRMHEKRDPIARARALEDPAKLSELHALAGKARGVDITHCHHNKRLTIDSDWTIYAHWSGECIVADNGDEAVVLTMPQARAILARIMATPPDESSREQCERLIRGSND